MIITRIALFLVRKLAVIILSFLVFSAASAWILLGTLGSQQAVSSWLSESNSYQRIPDTLFELIENDARTNPSGGEAVDSILETGIVDIDALKEIAATSYDEEFLQEQTEKVLDGTYAWLRGETERPVFSVSLAERSEVFTTEIGKKLGEELSALPKCDAVPTAENAFNLLAATCIPPNVDIPTEIAAFGSQLADFQTDQADNDKPLTAALTGDDLYDALDPDGLFLQDAYSAAKQSQWLFPILAVLMSVIIVLIARNRGEGLRTVGGTLVSSAISLGFGGVFLYVSDRLRATFYDSQPDEQVRIIANGFLEPFLKVVVSDVVFTIAVIVITLFVTGLVIWIVGIKLTPPLAQPTIDAQLRDSPKRASQSSGRDASQQTAGHANEPAAAPAKHSAQP